MICLHVILCIGSFYKSRHRRLLKSDEKLSTFGVGADLDNYAIY